MKHMKELIAGPLAVALLCCACSAGNTGSSESKAVTAIPLAEQEASTSAGFTDVPSGAWYAEAVGWCWDNGMMSGTSATTFAPEASMTRAMMVTVLHRAAGTPASTGENIFSDNAPGSWYYDAVVWAAANNVLAGYGDGRFGSSDPVTREQAAVILHQYAGSPDAGTALTAADASAVSTYAVNAVAWASANGLLRPDDSGRVNPKTNATRAEVAYMLYRHLGSSDTQTPAPTTDSQEPASNQGINGSSSQENDTRAVITINGKEYGMTITDTVVGRAFAQKLEAEGGYEITGSRAADDICCSESESLETDTSENMSWECGGVAWFDGWFTIWVSEAPSGRNRPVVAQIDTEHALDGQMAKLFGDSIGTMAEEMNVSGWYAPAMNMHRSAFGGRTFEYYSEDPLLSGCMAASAVSSAKEHGIYAYIKHFALNEQEYCRQSMLATWCPEQAIREIYLKPFEMCVKQGGATAVMSSYNYIGVRYTGAYPELLNDVLRGEWGFRGMVLTDYAANQGYGYMNADQIIRNGGSAFLATFDIGTNYVTDESSATAVRSMRQAV